MTNYLHNVKILLEKILNLDNFIYEKIINEYCDNILTYFDINNDTLNAMSKDDKIDKIIKYIIDCKSSVELTLSDHNFIETSAEGLLKYDLIIQNNLTELLKNNILPEKTIHDISFFYSHLQIKTIEDFIKNRLNFEYHQNRKNILLDLLDRYKNELIQINNFIESTIIN